MRGGERVDMRSLREAASLYARNVEWTWSGFGGTLLLLRDLRDMCGKRPIFELRCVWARGRRIRPGSVGPLLRERHASLRENAHDLLEVL